MGRRSRSITGALAAVRIGRGGGVPGVAHAADDRGERPSTLRLLLRSVMLTLLVGACGTVERAAAPADLEPSPLVITVSIAQGTQARLGDLRIGLVNVRSDDEGARPTATLQLLAGGGPSERVVLRAGDRTTRAAYTIFVTEVRAPGPLDGLPPRPGASSGGVTLLVKTP